MSGKHSKKQNENKTQETKKENKKKNKFKNILSNLILLICISLFIYSVIELFLWYKDSKAIENEMNQITQNVEIKEEPKEEKKEKVVKSNEKKSSPYWDYIKINLIDVDFKELKKVNSDVKGWIQVPNTSINYPFVQTTNNDYYLTHSITKQNNSAGWVFMDYRNDANSLNKNTILYAHSRVNQYMFGSLKNTLKQDWLKNTNNHVIKFSTEKHNALWQVFSIYHIPTTNDYIQTSFSDNNEFSNFITMLKNRSIHNFDTTVNGDDKILTLSTCYGNTEKLVVHAKLIKYSNK